MSVSSIGKLLKSLRSEMGITAQEASNLMKEKGINISSKTINGYENGRSLPNAEIFVQLCSIYNCVENPIDYINRIEANEKGTKFSPNHIFNTEEKILIENYRSLDEFNRTTLSILAKRMVEGCQRLINKIEKPIHFLPASAGNGQFLDSDDFEMMEFPEEVVPKDSTFAVRVSGDSMEPGYPDNSIVFVKRAKMLEPGEIGIFILNGEGYLKKLGKDNNLISFNPKYKDIVINEYDDLRVVGKVVGDPYLEE